MRLLETARRIFPLDRWVRNGPANYRAERRWPGSRPAAIAAIHAALLDDPWSPALRRNLAGFLLEVGDEAGAVREIDMVARLTPRSTIQLRVNVNPATR